MNPTEQKIIKIAQDLKLVYKPIPNEYIRYFSNQSSEILFYLFSLPDKENSPVFKELVNIFEPDAPFLKGFLNVLTSLYYEIALQSYLENMVDEDVDEYFDDTPFFL